jgi:hypothetical protein
MEYAMPEIAQQCPLDVQTAICPQFKHLPMPVEFLAGPKKVENFR